MSAGEQTRPPLRKDLLRVITTMQFGKSRTRRRVTGACLLVLLAVAAVYSLCHGVYSIPVRQTFRILISRAIPLEKTWTDTMYRVILYNRLPRVLGAMGVGAALSLAGAAYQGIFRNPLVSPDLLGVSHGACVGAAVAILLDLGYYGSLLLSFAGGVVAVLLTVSIPRLMKNRATTTLILSGVIVGGFFSSVLGILKYIADPDTELAEITYWQLGSLAKVRIQSLQIILPVIVVFSLTILLLRWRINALSMGDREARSLGVNVARERGLLILCATVLTAACICLCGTIGWIGLVIPHLSRMLVGENNTHVLPISTVMGMLFLVVVDYIARTLTGGEIPLSIITGIFGTPFFAFILMNQHQREG